MANSKSFSHAFTPWHGVLYTTIGTQMTHGFLQMINESLYKLKHGVNYNDLTAISNHGLAPHVRATSMPSNSAINFGLPWGGY